MRLARTSRLIASRTLFFALALVAGPLLAYGLVMLLTDGLGLVDGDSAALIPIALGTAAAMVLCLGRFERRAPREIAVAVLGSVVVTIVLAAALTAYTLTHLPPEFFN
ncbi:MAG: hypothetical protein ACJ744_07225 [Gaiellaceae bacterium]